MEGGCTRRTIERKLLDRVPALVGYWRRDETCAYANPQYIEHFGLDPDRVLGMSIREVLGDDHYAASRPRLEAVFAGEEQRFDRTVVDDDGKVRCTEVSYVPDVVDGEVVGLILHIVDVTEKVEAEVAARRSSALHRAMAASLPDSFVVAVDAARRVTLVEGPACELFGVDPAAVVGLPLADVLPGLAADLDDRWTSVTAGAYVCWDRVVSGRTVALRAAPLVDGDVYGVLVVGTDVTVERRRQTIAEATQRIAVATSRSTDVTSVCSLVAEEALGVFNAAHAAVSRFDAGRLQLVAVVPPLPGMPVGSVRPLDEATAAGKVALAGAPALVTYSSSDGPGARAALATGMVCAAAAPVWVQGVLWGSVSVGLVRSPRDEAAMLASVASFADAAGLAISSTAAWQRLEAEATTDHLTGLANRRAFDQRLGDLVSLATREGRPLSLVVFDLDGFKSVNDTMGHGAGDTVLQRVAAVAAATVRQGELLARTGGDEFSLVVAGDRRQARAAASRLGRAIRAVSGASFGTASLGAGTHDAEHLVAAADADLYDAKRRRGRSPHGARVA